VVLAGAALLGGALVLGSGALSLAWRTGSEHEGAARATALERSEALRPSTPTTRPPPIQDTKPKVTNVPGAPAPPPKVDIARVVINRRASAVEEAPPAEVGPTPPPVEVVASVGTATVSMSAVPGNFEIYIDGKLASKGALRDYAVPAGRHVFSIIAEDGRIKRYQLDLAADQVVRKSWDFDQGGD
jgi:hypothetical protein